MPRGSDYPPDDGEVREVGGDLPELPPRHMRNRAERLRALLAGDQAAIAAREEANRAAELEHVRATRSRPSTVATEALLADDGGEAAALALAQLDALDEVRVPPRPRSTAMGEPPDVVAPDGQVWPAGTTFRHPVREPVEPDEPDPAAQRPVLSWPAVRSLLDARLAAAEGLAGTGEERAALFRALVAKAEALAGEADATRRTLAAALDDARAAEEAAMARVGSARAAVAESDRAVPELAELAADGDTAAEKRLGKVREARATQADLLAAHDRRAREAATTRREAEAALAAHEAAALADAERMCDAVMVALAEHADAILAEAAATAAGIPLAVELRRSHRPREPWALPPVAGEAVWRTFQGSAQLAADRHHGELSHRAVKIPTLAAEARRALDCWRQGRDGQEG